MLGEGPITVVSEQGLRNTVVGYHDVGPPVSVEVVEGHSQSLAWVLADAARRRHVQKCPVALVLVKEVGNGGKLLRVAIRTQFWPATGDVMEIPLHIPTDEKVQVPIVIVVEKTGARGPAASSHPRPCRDIDEGSIAPVSEELSGGVLVTYKQVNIPVVVIIRPCGRGRWIRRQRQAGPQRDVREGSVAVVFQ